MPLVGSATVLLDLATGHTFSAAGHRTDNDLQRAQPLETLVTLHVLALHGGGTLAAQQLERTPLQMVAHQARFHRFGTTSLPVGTVHRALANLALDHEIGVDVGQAQGFPAALAARTSHWTGFFAVDLAFFRWRRRRRAVVPFLSVLGRRLLVGNGAASGLIFTFGRGELAFASGPPRLVHLDLARHVLGDTDQTKDVAAGCFVWIQWNVTAHSAAKIGIHEIIHERLLRIGSRR